MTRQEVIQNFVDACDTVGFFSEQQSNFDDCGKGACVNATYIGLEVLRRVGIDAKPEAYECIVVNDEAYGLMKQKVDISHWPDSAWSIHIGPRPHTEGGGVDFHVVIRLPEGILDLSSLQLNRPAKGINVPPAMFVSSDNQKHGRFHVKTGTTHYVLLNRKTKLPRVVRSATGFTPAGMLGRKTNSEWINEILEEMTND